jgi:hypothetical protein
MSYPFTDCCAVGPTVQVTNVPGAEGPTGPAGTDGTDGVSAFTTLTGAMTVPGNTATPVTVGVLNSQWLNVGQHLIIAQGVGSILANPGPAHFVVTAIPSTTSVTMTWLDELGDVAAGTAISSGAVVAAAGISGDISTPIAISDGGSGATTKAGAQTNYGLGQDALISTGTGLTQAITASSVAVGSIVVTIPATGSYLLSAYIRMSFIGVTFASSRTVTLIIKNITQGTTLATATYHTGTATTLDFPDADCKVPFVLYASGAVNDQLKLFVVVDVINSAGTFEIREGSLCAVPLRKS